MKNVLVLSILAMLCFNANAQFSKDRKVYLNQDGSQYLKFTMLNQIWVRNTQMNPGTTANGYAKNNYTDIGLRRIRMQMMAQLTDRAFLYVQVGQNNFNFLSDRKLGFFIHDATGEYELVKKKLSLGAGLTGWTGLSRFSSPSAGSIMGVDAPLFEQSTNDINDQFLRKLSVYAKGKLGKLDYRFTVASPLAAQKAAGYSPALTKHAGFSAEPPKLQTNGYVQWEFFDSESNQLPYATGSYLGSKKVFNIGAGFLYQPDAMWRQGLAATDTIRSAMKHFAIDAFFDAPVGVRNGHAISAYATFTHFDFGKGYIRNQSPMNPGNGTTVANLINGGGNGFPAYGTGNVLYAQVGYKFKDSLIGSTTLMPYMSMQHSKFDRLDKGMNYYDLGVNWLLKGHVSKLTLAYQDRPVYYSNTDGFGILTERKGALVLQYQVFFN